MKDRQVKIPKIGWVKIKQTKEVIGHITSVTVTKEATGRYFISIATRFEENYLPANERVVAIVPTMDGGFFTSDGEYYKNTFVTSEWLEKLKREEAYQYRLKDRALASGKPLSKAKNYQKQVKKVTRMYSTLDCHREDFLHKMTTELVKKYGVICIPKYYTRSRLADTFFDEKSDHSWERLVHKLSYKCQWYGRIFHAVKLERNERDMNDEKLAQSLRIRATKYAIQVRK